MSLCLQLNHQNRSLKRKSMMLLSHLTADTITKINLDDEEEEYGEDLQEARGVCLSPLCKTTISGIRRQGVWELEVGYE